MTNTSRKKYCPPLPTTTAMQVRHAIFAPVDRLKQGVLKPTNNDQHYRNATEIIVKNQFRTVIISGNVFGPHQLLLDVLLTCFQQVRMVDGGVAIEAELYGTARRMGRKRASEKDAKWVQGLLTDMRVCSFRYLNEVEDRFSGIVSEHSYSTKCEKYIVFLSPAFVKFMDKDIHVKFTEKEVVDVLAKMPSQVRAVARFMRSHEPGACWSINKAVRAVQQTEISERHARRLVATVIENENLLLELGMEIDLVKKLIVRTAQPDCRGQSNPKKWVNADGPTRFCGQPNP